MQHQIKQESSAFFQTLFGFALVALVMTGIGGTIYKVVAPDGWVAQAFGKGLSAGSSVIGTLLVIGFLAWISRSWTSERTQGKVGDLVIYTFAAAGLLYALRFWTTGVF